MEKRVELRQIIHNHPVYYNILRELAVLLRIAGYNQSPQIQNFGYSKTDVNANGICSLHATKSTSSS